MNAAKRMFRSIVVTLALVANAGAPRALEPIDDGGGGDGGGGGDPSSSGGACYGQLPGVPAGYADTSVGGVAAHWDPDGQCFLACGAGCWTFGCTRGEVCSNGQLVVLDKCYTRSCCQQHDRCLSVAGNYTDLCCNAQAQAAGCGLEDAAGLSYYDPASFLDSTIMYFARPGTRYLGDACDLAEYPPNPTPTPTPTPTPNPSCPVGITVSESDCVGLCGGSLQEDSCGLTVCCLSGNCTNTGNCVGMTFTVSVTAGPVSYTCDMLGLFTDDECTSSDECDGNFAVADSAGNSCYE